MRLRIIAAVSLVVLLSFSVWAQQGGQNAAPGGRGGGRGQAPAAPAGPPTVTVVTAADVAAMIAKSPADRNALGQRLIQLGVYSVNMEHRVTNNAASVHEKEAELFYVIEGSGTIVTGGKLVEEKRTNDTNLSGTSIEGGVSRKISKGDFVLVPEGVPHQIPSVEGALTVMTLHLPR
jgi:mannose-6-phosphate isomerase-like protein (cupin superfamily)